MPRLRAFIVLTAAVLLFGSLGATAAQADGGAVRTTAQSITADDSPPLTTQVSVTTPGGGDTAQIEVRTTTPSEVTSVSIDFGDGGPVLNPTPAALVGVNHTFPGPRTYPLMVEVVDSAGRVAEVTDHVAIGTRMVAVTPKRVLDTRNGTGAPEQPVGPGGTVRLKVAGVAGVPATGVGAVTMNVTDAHATAGSYVTAYPDGATPVESNLNFRAGQVNPNEVTVPVAADGYVDLYNAAGKVDLIADLQGYYATTANTGDPGGLFTPTTPTRILDTRNGTGAPAKPAGPNSAVALTLPADTVPVGATAVVLNVTDTRPTAGGYVTVYPGNSPRPTASNLDFLAGQTTANQVTVPIDSSRRIKLYNAVGQTDLLADVQGYFGTTGGVYVPLSAMPRMLDTRIGDGAPQMRAGAGESLNVQFTDRFGNMPDGDGTAALLNLTGINPSTSTYLAVESPGATVGTSDVNLAPGETRAGLAVAPVTRYSGEEYFSLYNAFGKLDIVADLQGYYAPTR